MKEQELAESFHDRADVKFLMAKKKQARHNHYFSLVSRYERDLEALWGVHKNIEKEKP